MANIIPFKATLPSRDKVHLVASRSYISYSKPHLRGKLASNPFSFLHVINPDFFSQTREKNQVKRFNLVKEKYKDFKDKGYFEEKKNPYFFLYKQTKFENEYSGFIGGASVIDYLEEHIRIHEHTISKREKMFTEYLETTGFNAEPVLISHPKSDQLSELKRKYYGLRPEFDFSTTDFARHQFWIIDRQSDIDLIKNEFQNFENLYIADGHHRCASSARMAENALKKNEKVDEKMFFMSLFIDEEELNVLPFHRIVSNIKPYNTASFLEKIKENFEVVEPVYRNYEGPQEKHSFGMYLDGRWYQLQKQIKDSDISPTTTLDTKILSNIVFEGLLGVKDIKKDKRIKFIGGTYDMKELELAVDKRGNKVSFALYPTSVDEIKKVADAHEVMPPKSTWIEPKLRSGLVIYEF